MTGYIVVRNKEGALGLKPITGKRLRKDIRREPQMPVAAAAPKEAKPRYMAYNAAKKAWSEHWCPVAAQEACSTTPGSMILDRMQRAYMKWLAEGYTDWIEFKPGSPMSTMSTMSTACGQVRTQGER